MKLTTLATATAAIALLSGAAQAQQPQPQPGPTAGSVTGDWNGAHAPTDDKQYQEKVAVPVGAMPSANAGSTPTDIAASGSASGSTTAGTDAAATGASADASFTNTTVTNGPVPDTRENRAKYGQPMSRAGKMTAARGN